MPSRVMRRPPATATASESKVKPIECHDDLMDEVQELTWPIQQELDQVDKKLTEFEPWKQRREFLLAKLRKIYDAVAGPQMRASLSAMPYDTALRKVLAKMPLSTESYNYKIGRNEKKPIAGVLSWGKLKAEGASDDQIRRNLKAFSHLKTYGTGAPQSDGHCIRTSGQGVSFARGKINDYPESKGELMKLDRLVKETRRVLQIPEAKKQAKPAPPPAATKPKPAAKSPAKAKAKKKPAAQPAPAAKPDRDEVGWLKELRALLADRDMLLTSFLTLDNSEVRAFLDEGLNPTQAADRYCEKRQQSIEDRKQLANSSAPTKRDGGARQPDRVEPKTPGDRGIGQTYGQWFATLKGNAPKEIVKAGKLGGPGPHEQDADLVRIYNAGKSPSEARQILAAAGWFDEWVGDDVDERLMHYGSRAKLDQRSRAIVDDDGLDTRAATPALKKLERRQVAMRTWEQAVESIGVTKKGAMAEAETAGALA